MPGGSNTPESLGDPATIGGTRRAPRKRRTLAIECRGPDGLRVEARTVDVSQGGTLIEVTDPTVFATERPGRYADRGDEIRAMFPEGVHISFGDGAVLACAEFVRCVAVPERPEAVLLGCKFDPPLTPGDCRLLGIEVGGDETHDGTNGVRRAVRQFATIEDALVGFIDSKGCPWSESEGAIDARPIAVSKPGATLGAKIAFQPKLRPAPAVAAGPAKPTAVAAPVKAPTTLSMAAPAAPPVHGEGVTDDDLRRIGRERSRATIAAVPGKAAAWTGPGGVTAYLFPSMAGAMSARYHGRLEALDDRTVIVELPVPAGDGDPIGHGAGLGEAVRVVLVSEGHVLGEVPCRVTQLEETAQGSLRATLAPTSKPPDALRRAVSR